MLVSISKLYYSFCNNFPYPHCTVLKGTPRHTFIQTQSWTHIIKCLAGRVPCYVSLIRQPRSGLPPSRLPEPVYRPLPTTWCRSHFHLEPKSRSEESEVHCTNDFQAFAVRLLQKVYDFELNKKNIVYSGWKSRNILSGSLRSSRSTLWGSL